MFTRRRCCPTARCWSQGEITSGGSLTSAELYDPASGTWTATGSLNTARDAHTATLLPNGKVLVAGGAEAAAFSRQRGTVRPGQRDLDVPPAASTPHAVVTRRRCCPTARCWSQGDLTTAALLPARNCTIRRAGPGRATGSLTTARDVHTATLLPNGKVLVAGGTGYQRPS